VKPWAASAGCSRSPPEPRCGTSYGTERAGRRRRDRAGPGFPCKWKKRESALGRTRTCDLLIRSQRRGVSGRCSRLQYRLTYAVFALPALPTVAVCCTGLVSKLVSTSASLTSTSAQEIRQRPILHRLQKRGCNVSRTDSGSVSLGSNSSPAASSNTLIYRENAEITKCASSPTPS
jgi:hypothetical protein